MLCYDSPPRHSLSDELIYKSYRSLIPPRVISQRSVATSCIFTCLLQIAMMAQAYHLSPHSGSVKYDEGMVRIPSDNRYWLRILSPSSLPGCADSYYFCRQIPGQCIDFTLSGSWRSSRAQHRRKRVSDIAH